MVTIEIRQPELEALILERMRQGQSAEDIMMEALGLAAAQPPAPPSGWRTMRGIARGDGELLTETLTKERAADEQGATATQAFPDPGNCACTGYRQ